MSWCEAPGVRPAWRGPQPADRHQGRRARAARPHRQRRCQAGPRRHSPRGHLPLRRCRRSRLSGAAPPRRSRTCRASSRGSNTRSSTTLRSSAELRRTRLPPGFSVLRGGGSDRRVVGDAGGPRRLASGRAAVPAAAGPLSGGLLVALATGQTSSLGTDAGLLAVSRSPPARKCRWPCGHAADSRTVARSTARSCCAPPRTDWRRRAGQRFSAAVPCPFVVMGNVAGNELTHVAAAVILGGLLSTTLLNLLAFRRRVWRSGPPARSWSARPTTHPDGQLPDHQPFLRGATDDPWQALFLPFG